MTHIGKLAWFGHLRAEPNQHILHYRKGHLKRSGRGLAYWFDRLTAAIAMVPVEDCEATMMHRERTRDLQEVVVQVTLTYRFERPDLAAGRLNFTLDLDAGVWVDAPLDKATAFWFARVQGPIRAYMAQVALSEAIHTGAERVAQLIREALAANGDIEAMGMALVGVQVVSIAPSAELEKALQTPAREALQQKADEAVFARRAQAVEKERAIRENELATELELARRQEALIAQNGANRMREAQSKAEADMTGAEAEAARVRVKAEGDTAARRMYDQAIAEGEAARVEVWKHAPGRTLLGLALQEAARNIQQIGHLNITPNLLGDAFQKLLTDEGS